MSIKALTVLKRPRYLAIAIISTVLMAAIYIYSQVLGIIENIDLWFKIIPWYNALLFATFAILFGITLSYQIYVWRQPKTCKISNKVGSAGASSSSVTGIFLVAQCPACASLGTLFLPLSIITFLTKFSWLINLIGLGILLFTINYLGGFKRE